LNLSKLNLVRSIGKDVFSTYNPMAEPNAQYKLINTKIINPPFEHTTIISEYLNRNFKNQFSATYKQYRNENTFIIDDIKAGDFKLLNCFCYNIELFEDGRFLVHFLPTSRVITDVPLTIELFRKYKSLVSPIKSGLFLNLVDSESSKSRKIFFGQDNDESIFRNTIQSWKTVFATVDFELLAAVSPKSFQNILLESKTNISSGIKALLAPAALPKSGEGIKLYDKAFLPIKVNQSNSSNNLMIGDNKKASKLSATYYSGIYSAVSNKNILPVIFGVKTNELAYFKNLISNHFNKNGTISWHDAVYFPVDSVDADIELKILSEIKDKKNTFLTIFCSGKIDENILSKLRDTKWKYQIYQGNTDQYKLSNFVIKCLSKMGGLPALIHNSHASLGTYFVGMELGHMHMDNKPRLTNLALVFFDYQGKYIYQYVSKGLEINEVIQEDTLLYGLKKFINYLTKMSLKKVQKLIFHRDGKLHATEIETIISSCRHLFGIDDIDIVEIIKSGHPVMAVSKQNVYHNQASGACWLLKEKKYAILITSDQANEKSEILNPIVIKHRHGQADFHHIVDQVYWFTKLYSTNIYYSTRLPITTATANNIVGTGSKKHQASYKG